MEDVMDMTSRAYAFIETKALDEEKREFSGWATTPEPDRVQDTINPLGAVFKNPLVLLHQHRHDAPVGSVRFEKPTEKGIRFTATIPVIKEPGPLKDRVDTAWGELKAGLVRAVSIGFRPLKYAFLDEGGIDFQEVEIFELSLVTIPMNASAIIDAVKSYDQQLRKEAGALEHALPKPISTDLAASGKTGSATSAKTGHRVVKLADTARVRAKPFVINKIHR
ncbi:HK97 family phage prohead protease [Ponticaulis profundi]|uniref:HK97 family phage prohead protease n=1 Tax=Ponticaulis profundi TaxID=2665222 RepID=A0ABW1S885_9PROT